MTDTLPKIFLCIECDKCAICLDNFSPCNINISYTNCGHKFHSSYKE
uniref:RING-type domain-containing protein n=1 Tax=viral metagenome TaxID=1070528 RepID=A0A6C0AFE7_9ZZZZ